MIRRTMVLVVALLLVLATAPGVAAKAGGTDRPLRMDFSLTIYWTTEPIPGCWVQTNMEGTGVATHLGRTTMHARHCPPLAPGEAYHDGRMTLTGANGDTLTLTYDGDPNSTAPAVITGGTGRFVGASGQLRSAVEFTWNPFDQNGMPIAPWYATSHWWGTIAY
jgi:hypothetical protein